MASASSYPPTFLTTQKIKTRDGIGKAYWGRRTKFLSEITELASGTTTVMGVSAHLRGCSEHTFNSLPFGEAH